MKYLFSIVAVAIAAPSYAAELVANNPFTDSASSGSFSGQYGGGQSAATGWYLWNNTDASTTTEVLASFQGRSNVLHIATTGAHNGVFQFLAGGAQYAQYGYGDFWVASGRALYLAADNGAGVLGSQTETTEAWERVSVGNGLSSFNEVALYSSGGPADFYISVISAIAAPAVPEPATWAMMLAGFAGVGFAMRRRQQVTMRVSYAV